MIPRRDTHGRSHWSQSRPTAHTDSGRTLAEARLTKSGNRSSAARRDHTDSLVNTDNKIHSFINTSVYILLILSFICEDKHLQSFYLSFRV